MKRHFWLPILLFILPVILCDLAYKRLVYPSLPDVHVLEQFPLEKGKVPVFDNSGRFLFDYEEFSEGKEILPLGEFSPNLIAAVIATEDRSFFTNRGFSIWSIIRAFIQNHVFRQTFSGASTITQQLVKNILEPPDERYEQSYSRKLKEVLIAFEVTKAYPKEKILEIYLNEMNFGGFTNGAEAAAKSLLGISARELTLEQAARIAGMPQAPGFYSRPENAGALDARQEEVIRIMQRIWEKGQCIFIGANRPPVCAP